MQAKKHFSAEQLTSISLNWFEVSCNKDVFRRQTCRILMILDSGISVKRIFALIAQSLKFPRSHRLIIFEQNSLTNYPRVCAQLKGSLFPFVIRRRCLFQDGVCEQEHLQAGGNG